MKKLLLFLAAAFVFVSANDLNAQAKKYPLFEHYTQASCGPCAAQNPAFQDLYFRNLDKAHHIAIHTSWPGYDPMYNINTSESDAMVDYYNVTGVPNMFADGEDVGSPVSVSQGMINDISSQTSPVGIKVEQTIDGTDVTARVTIDVLGAVPAGNYILRVAAAEFWIDYATAPGSNGEKEFPNVFRKFVANGLDGESLTLTQGETLTYEYTYALNAAWDADQIYTLAWIAETNGKTVLNSGASYDIDMDVKNLSAKSFVAGVENDGKEFSAIVSNTGTEDLEVEITFTSDAPADWAAHYSIGGNEYTDGTTLTLPPGDHSINFEATPGATAAISNFAITVQPTNSVVSSSLQYKIISGITDLVPYRANITVDIVTPFTSGLSQTISETYAALEDDYLVEGLADGTLDDIKNIYYSVGWSFPAITTAQAEALKAFMDRGGNVMITGQDIGWDIFDPNGNANNAINKDLINNYFFTDYVDDGGASRTQFVSETSDAIFGLVGASTISRPYGNTSIYPDRIRANSSEAKEIFHYNNAAEKSGTRAETSTYKTVYLGVGLEHIAVRAVADEIMRLTHDWFNGLITSTEFDEAIAALQMGQNYPNPASFETVIPFEGAWKNEVTLQVTDLNGRVMMQQDVASGTKSVRLNTSELPAGVYFYQITDGEHIGAPHKLVVAH